jgi:hypothetical protein
MFANILYRAISSVSVELRTDVSEISSAFIIMVDSSEYFSMFIRRENLKSNSKMLIKVNEQQGPSRDTSVAYAV